MQRVRSAKIARARQAAGFTLIELLVAFSLLGLIAVVSLGALRFGTRVWDRTTAISEAGHHLQLAQDLLRRQLERAVTRIRSQTGTGAKLFQGGPDALAFVGPLPGRGAIGGLYDQRLRLSDDRLLLTWRTRDRADRPLPEGSASPAVAGEAVVLDGVAKLEIAYLDLQDPGLRQPWAPRWDKRGLPPLVRLKVSFSEPGRGGWPELLVRLPLAKRGQPLERQDG